MLGLKEKLRETKAMFNTRPEAKAVESFAFHEQTSDEMESYEIKCKLECIRFALESCVDKPGHFQMEKIGFIADMGLSMGFGIECSIAENIWESNGMFRVYSTECSPEFQVALNEQGQEFEKRYLMLYRYEEVRTSANTVKPVFKMEVLNAVKSKKVVK